MSVAEIFNKPRAPVPVIITGRRRGSISSAFYFAYDQDIVMPSILKLMKSCLHGSAIRRLSFE